MGRLADTVDAVLEAGVVPSFTRIGPAVRSRLDGWTPVDRYDLHGRVVVVTGATSGLGLAAARTLGGLGATIEIVGRNPQKTADACAQLEEDGVAAGYTVADTGDLDAVRSAAAELTGRHRALHVLVHNAGALDAQYGTTAQGIEQTVASQVVGPFLLTALLRDALRAGAPSRVLWMASGGMYSQPLDVDQLEMRAEDYDGTKAYARAKRAQVTLAEVWAEQLRADRIVVHALHPGWADTPGVARSLPRFRKVVGPLLRSPDQGAGTLVWLAADDGEPLRTTGCFWHDRRPRSPHKLPSTRRADTTLERARLWEWCVARSGCDPDDA